MIQPRLDHESQECVFKRCFAGIPGTCRARGAPLPPVAVLGVGGECDAKQSVGGKGILGDSIFLEEGHVNVFCFGGGSTH